MLNRFVEATAVMVVTRIVAQIIVFVILPKPKRHKKLHGDENELALTE